MNTPTPGVIRDLAKNQVFVFGSNEAGHHGRGAAYTAEQWGARNGVGYGLEGQTFAIPTKDSNIQTLPLKKIQVYVEKFTEFAATHQQYHFLVTRIGCGLAGCSVNDIAPMFFTASTMKNVSLSQDFYDAIQVYQNSLH